MRVFVTGGCGYKGTVLIPKLLSLGYNVVAFDIMWFGNYLQPHPNLEIIKGDIRQVDKIKFNKIDAIIHLASVANDPCSDLNPKLTWEINVLGTMQLIDKAVRENVKQFIFASSSSVYGIKKEKNVTEDLSLEPISEYNKSKMVAERVILSYSNKILCQIVRPATVCGFSERMRLDVSVNMLTMQALKNKKITVFGGEQLRPNIHIDDITDLYIHFLKIKHQANGIFNAGFENIKIIDLSKKINEYLPTEIIISKSNDKRSYSINSDKILKTGFKPKKKIENAIKELIILFKDCKIQDKPVFYNLKWMQKKQITKN